MNGYFNSEMNGGVFRSGKIGPYAIISSETKIVTGVDNFFSTNLDGDATGTKHKKIKPRYYIKKRINNDD